MEKSGISKSHLSAMIKSKATQLGFTACGFAPANAVDEEQQQRFFGWLQKEYNGKMQYMANYTDKRMDPRELVPGALSVISLALNYHQKDFQPDDAWYKVSQYAAGLDYHYVIKEKLAILVEYIKEFTPVESHRIFADSAPVHERYWAIRAGLGWTGKNACLIIPQKGSFFFLSEIILDVELDYDTPFEKNHCGNCTRCMDACPTGAIVAPGQIDARRCTSYNTIELKDMIPTELRGKSQRFIFGCDICQNVCPHNKRFAKPYTESSFDALPSIRNWSRSDWENLDNPAFKKNFMKISSPISRAGFKKLKDNIDSARSADNHNPGNIAD
jgi:epoxyqueuosine reductase